MANQEFIVNQYITLKLEDGDTIIYLDGKKFYQCKFLLLTIDPDYLTGIEDIDSIDEAAEKLDHSLEEGDNDDEFIIPPETEFWGHCSNLQAWVENDYDTRILHRNIAFPLLKKLTKAGDFKARKVFRDEIARRFASGHVSVMTYLHNTKYLTYLNPEEKKTLYKKIFNDGNLPALLFLLKSDLLNIFKPSEILPLINDIDFKDIKNEEIKIVLPLLEALYNRGNAVAFTLFKEEIERRIKQDTSNIAYVINLGYLYRFNKSEIEELIDGIDYESIRHEDKEILFPILTVFTNLGNKKAKSTLKDEIIKLCIGASQSQVMKIIHEGYFRYLDIYEIEHIVKKTSWEGNNDSDIFQTIPVLKKLAEMGSPTAEKHLKNLISNNLKIKHPNRLLKQINEYFILTNYQKRMHNQLIKLNDTITKSSSEDIVKLKIEFNKIAKKFIENLKKLQLNLKEK